jgi:hypothetical protein
VAPMKYYRDFNKDLKIDESGNISVGNNSTNIHPNSYVHKAGIKTWLIGGWSTGCIVINNLTKYWESLMLNCVYNKPITLTCLKEF